MLREEFIIAKSWPIITGKISFTKLVGSELSEQVEFDRNLNRLLNFWKLV